MPRRMGERVGVTGETGAGTGRVEFRLSMLNPFTLDAVSACAP